jgi:hypothetical protein
MELLLFPTVIMLRSLLSSLLKNLKWTHLPRSMNGLCFLLVRILRYSTLFSAFFLYYFSCNCCIFYIVLLLYI